MTDARGVRPARENPFATERVEGLLGFDLTWLGLTWERIEARLEELSWRCVVAGPHGSGKTTFLDALERRLWEGWEEGKSKQTGRVQWSRGCTSTEILDAVRRAVQSAGEDGAVLLDGLELAPWWTWRRVMKLLGPDRKLVATTHGVTRGLPVLFETQSRPEMLHCFILTLAPEWETLWTEADSAKLWKKHGGNLRHALRECYDLAGKGGPDAP